MTLTFPQTPEGQPSEQTRSLLVRVQEGFITFIRGLFAELPRGAYHWEPSSGTSQDQEGSEIFIGSETPIDPEIVGSRPSVVVARGSAAFHGIGLGDQAFYDQQTGAFVKMDMIPTTININVVSRVKFEAEELAWFIANQIWTLRHVILRANPYILYTGQRPMLSAPSGAGALVQGPQSDEDYIVVTISMPAFLQHTSVAMPLNRPVVGEIRMVATATGPQPKLRPRRPLVGTAVFSPEPASLPQNSDSEAQSSEPLTVRFKT